MWSSFSVNIMASRLAWRGRRISLAMHIARSAADMDMYIVSKLQGSNSPRLVASCSLTSLHDDEQGGDAAELHHAEACEWDMETSLDDGIGTSCLCIRSQNAQASAHSSSCLGFEFESTPPCQPSDVEPGASAATACSQFSGGAPAKANSGEEARALLELWGSFR